MKGEDFRTLVRILLGEELDGMDRKIDHVVVLERIENAFAILHHLNQTIEFTQFVHVDEIGTIEWIYCSCWASLFQTIEIFGDQNKTQHQRRIGRVQMLAKVGRVLFR